MNQKLVHTVSESPEEVEASRLKNNEAALARMHADLVNVFGENAPSVEEIAEALSDAEDSLSDEQHE